jgi:hypothetical protein
VSAWRFSWRAVGAGLAAASVAAIAFALTLTLCSAWVDAAVRTPAALASTAALLTGLAVAAFAVGGGFLLVLVSLISSHVKAPRPWTEAALLAIAAALVTTVGGVDLELTSADGVLSPFNHAGAFFVAYIAPAAAGALMGLLYGRFAKVSAYHVTAK